VGSTAAGAATNNAVGAADTSSDAPASKGAKVAPPLKKKEDVAQQARMYASKERTASRTVTTMQGYTASLNNILYHAVQVRNPDAKGYTKETYAELWAKTVTVKEFKDKHLFKDPIITGHSMATVIPASVTSKSTRAVTHHPLRYHPTVAGAELNGLNELKDMKRIMSVGYDGGGAVVLKCDCGEVLLDCAAQKAKRQVHSFLRVCAISVQVCMAAWRYES
jgi:hypothetical protein